jgi:putative intracellular protease/amidase
VVHGGGLRERGADVERGESARRVLHARRFAGDAAAQAALASTRKLGELRAEDYDAVFYPGGHGPLWDLAEDRDSIALIEAFDRAGKPIGAVCHAPAALRHVRAADGTPLVRGRRVTGFSNEEEEGVQLTKVVPFLLEDMLGGHGARYESGPAWQPHVVEDGRLVTGQNPASSEPAAEALLRQLR